jgi:ubiquinone/menaquinone biosynthesis C-methylase UbiE
MKKPIGNLSFKIMAALLRLFKKEPFMRQRLEFAGIREGQVVLDFGSGPGYFSALAAEIVGPYGKVYAADIQPLVTDYIENLKKKRNLENLVAIVTDCDTSLQDESVDVILLFDVIHMLEDPYKVLREMIRILKSDGILCVDVYHMSVERAIGIAESAGFSKDEQLENTINFVKNIEK